MKLYERIENNNFDEIDKNRAIELIEGGNGHLVYNENYFKLQKENEELKFEERRRIIGKYGDSEIHDVINRTLSNDYIPVQKVKDKIEHYQKLQDNYIEKYDEINEGLQAMINALQELLEGRK
jgi:hypothetical protein